MIQEHRLTAMTDILKLDAEQFQRFLPDLAAWWELCRDLEGLGAEPTAMVWVDDGRPGEIHGVELTIRETGEQYMVPGPAWSKA